MVYLWKQLLQQTHEHIEAGLRTEWWALGKFSTAFERWNERKKWQAESTADHNWSVRRQWKENVEYYVIFCKCLVHLCLSRPLLCCFLSVCLLCSGVPLTLQCRGFGLNILKLFSFVSSEIYPLNVNWGIHGHKLHRDYNSMFECFSFFWSEHLDLEACCCIDCNS